MRMRAVPPGCSTMTPDLVRRQQILRHYAEETRHAMVEKSGDGRAGTTSCSVLSKLARARGGVRPHWGITVIPTCGAAPAPVMPQVRPGYFHICT